MEIPVPILSPTKLTGSVTTVLINADRDQTLESTRLESVDVSFAGFAGDSHAGLPRPSCVRVKHQYDEGTPIRNTRQVSILSSEELDEVASAIGLKSLEPEWVGANLLITGIPNLTLLPPSTRLIFSSGASLVVDMENAPCVYPAEIIEQHHPGHGERFPRVAINKRGITAWVEREGRIQAGDSVTVHFPPQRLYPMPDTDRPMASAG